MADINNYSPITGRFLREDGTTANIAELMQSMVGGTGVVKPQNYLYVAKSGNDTTGDGSANLPYLTWGKAISVATSGTAIAGFPGTYTEDITFKAGVSLISPIKFGVYISGNHTANFTGTVVLDNITLQSATGTTLAFSGTGAQNFQLLNSSVNATAGDAINWTNTNASSKIYFEDGTCNVTTSGASARCVYTAATARGSFIANRVSFRLADNPNNVCIALNGYVAFTHTSDQIVGQVAVANAASATIAQVAMVTASVPVLTTSSTGTTAVINDTVYTSASPAFTGTGVLTDVALLYLSTGVGGASTLNGGLGPISLPMSSVKIRASSLVPAGQVAAGQNTGALEFDGDDLYFTKNTLREPIGKYLSTPKNNIVYVDNGRTDTYTPDGSFTKPFKGIQAAHDSITGSSATNTFAIMIALGLPYTGDLTISKDYITIAGNSVSKGAGYTGTITVTSQHCCFEDVHFNTGTVVNVSMPGHFLFELKSVRASHTTFNFEATGTEAEKADTWIQVSGNETLFLSSTASATGIMGEIATLGGAYEGNTFTATGSIYTVNASTALTNTFNVETGTTARMKCLSAKGNTVNLKTGGALYADITALADDGNTLNNTGGTLYRVSDAQVRKALETITSAAAGDMFYLNASGTLTRLPIGTVGQILKVSSGGSPEWAAT